MKADTDTRAYPNIEWEAHEGMVTVYDVDGRYVGCMGRETWDNIVSAPDAARQAEATTVCESEVRCLSYGCQGDCRKALDWIQEFSTKMLDVDPGYVHVERRAREGLAAAAGDTSEEPKT